MNIAVALRSEIVRLARKELRNETQQLKKAAASFRSEVAALKRRTLELEKALRGLRKQVPSKAEPPPTDAADSKLRFSAKGLATQRKRLGLSAHEVGLLGRVHTNCGDDDVGGNCRAWRSRPSNSPRSSTAFPSSAGTSA